MRRGGLGAGIGIATLLYFLNLIANITNRADFLRYVTPFAYADGAEIVTSLRLDAGLVLLAVAVGTACAAVGFFHYCKKDIA